MKILILLILIPVVSFELSSCSNNVANNSKNMSANNTNSNEKNNVNATKRTKMFLANFKTSENLPDLSDGKGQAAFNLALEMTNKYSNISLAKKDSLIKEWAKLTNRATVYSLGKELEADKMVFINVNKLENVLRVDLNIVDMEDASIKQFGKGYSLIKYRNKETDSQVYDTALLTAIQRALAKATNDSLLYDNQKGNFQVYPTPVIVIGGLDFQENSESTNNNTILSKWNLFKNKEVNSFDAVETIFEQVYKSKTFSPYDVASRDSMFAYFGMYGIDNCHLPSIEEINILSTMEVDYYIFGVVNKLDKKAKITLSLNRVLGKELVTQKTVIGELEKDDVLEFRTEIKRLVSELLE